MTAVWALWKGNFCVLTFTFICKKTVFSRLWLSVSWLSCSIRGQNRCLLPCPVAFTHKVLVCPEHKSRCTKPVLQQSRSGES